MKNMKRIAQTTLMAAAMAVTVSTTRASWAYVPLELRLAGADLVVVGKIDRLTDNFKVGERMHDVGAITVQRMLKGPGNLKEAQVAWPGKARFALSTDIRYRVGQQGIWILTRDAKQPNVYRANYPTDYQAAANLPKILAALKKLSKMKWSPAKAGLQMAVLVEQRDMRGAKVRVGGKPVKALAQASVYLMARNATGKPVHVANYRFDQPLKLKFTGPDGKLIPVKLYGVRPPKPPPPAKYNFIALPPGEMRPISHGLGLPMITRPGKYQVTLSYANDRDGDKLVAGPVWRGKLTVPVLEFSVAGPK